MVAKHKNFKGVSKVTSTLVSDRVLQGIANNAAKARRVDMVKKGRKKVPMQPYILSALCGGGIKVTDEVVRAVASILGKRGGEASARARSAGTIQTPEPDKPPETRRFCELLFAELERPDPAGRKF